MASELSKIQAAARESLNATRFTETIDQLGFERLKEGPTGAVYRGKEGNLAFYVLVSHDPDSLYALAYMPDYGSTVDIVRVGRLISGDTQTATQLN